MRFARKVAVGIANDVPTRVGLTTAVVTEAGRKGGLGAGLAATQAVGQKCFRRNAIKAAFDVVGLDRSVGDDAAL